MAFFLGLSIVSILECLCYCCICSVRRCSGDDDDEEERQKWKEQMNHNEIHPEDREEARQRAANRQQQFNEMEARLKQMDMSQFEANRR